MKKYESFGNAYLNGKVYGNLYPSNNDNKQEEADNAKRKKYEKI